MAKRILVFQHTPWETPGKILCDTAEKCDVKWEVVRVWQQPIPDLSQYDALMVLSGGFTIRQEKQYPFLIAEKQSISQCIADDRPCLGFGLGHHLLAEALGAIVGPQAHASMGFATGFLTHDGREHPVFAGLPTSMTIFKWHDHAVQEPLPRHVTLLATSAECQVEAISVMGRPHLVGVQFDDRVLELEDMEFHLKPFDESTKSIKGHRKRQSGVVQTAVSRNKGEMEWQFATFLTNFLSLVRSR